MKTLLCLFVAALVIFAPACSSRGLISGSGPSKPLPPGQAKKYSGSKSAKPFAPGQQKKRH